MSVDAIIWALLGLVALALLGYLVVSLIRSDKG
ncbi:MULTISPECIES: potassium-transporting ATPase subunit F [Arthrobacter]|uniref:Potassium-transporting ATPase subunit F n=2 Tax=Arthrobacter TaxID=1663 RepID=A0ABU9KKY3_9MICC|nr:potassium-transporting ATPase subunit F [Arthrobacter sp. YJM1]MDP5227498.1 potassium-transporting ATPase subunit F [Arthrobacter sp. YJM1]